jgi:hypothetical protein
MLQNVAVATLLFVSAGVYGKETVAANNVAAKNSYKPKLKEATEIRKYTQELFHKSAIADAKAPIADIKSGKLKPAQHTPEELLHSVPGAPDASAVAAPVPVAVPAGNPATPALPHGHAHAHQGLRGGAHHEHVARSTLAVVPRREMAPPQIPPHTVLAHARHMNTQGAWLSTSKTKFFSPNKGFIEYSFYEDWLCSTPSNSTGVAVNFCYYDEETESSSAEVAVLKKYPSSTVELDTNHFAFNDAYCTSVDATNTTADYSGYTRGYCFTNWNYNWTTNSYEFLYAWKMDHVYVPTVNATSSSIFSFYEYKTEASCHNWNHDLLATYSSFTTDDIGCSEFMYDGEYFTVSCSDSTPQVNIYSDSDCSTYLRSEDFSDLCDSEYFTYPTRIVCDSTA